MFFPIRIVLYAYTRQVYISKETKFYFGSCQSKKFVFWLKLVQQLQFAQFGGYVISMWIVSGKVGEKVLFLTVLKTASPNNKRINQNLLVLLLVSYNLLAYVIDITTARLYSELPYDFCDIVERILTEMK